MVNLASLVSRDLSSGLTMVSVALGCCCFRLMSSAERGASIDGGGRSVPLGLASPFAADVPGSASSELVYGLLPAAVRTQLVAQQQASSHSKRKVHMTHSTFFPIATVVCRVAEAR